MNKAPLFLLLLAGAACQSPRPSGEDAFDAVPQDWDGPTAIEIQVEIYDSPHAYEDFEALAEAGPLEPSQAPRLMVQPYQPANLTILNEQAYISHFEVERSELAMVADPVVDVLQEGLILDLAAHRLGGGEVAGWLKYTESELLKMDQAELDIVEGGYPITIQLPSMRTWSDAAVLEPNAHGRWLLNLGRRASGNYRLLAVRAREVPLRGGLQPEVEIIDGVEDGSASRVMEALEAARVSSSAGGR